MQHPFLSKDFYVNWQELTPDKIVPDIRFALQNAKTAIQKICEQKDSEISFDTSFLAFSEATRELADAWGRVCHLESVENTPELRQAYNEVLPEVTEFFSGLTLNAALWSVIEKAAQAPKRELSSEEQRFVSETLKDFQENGAALASEQKARLATINAELARLTTKFGENVLDSTNAWEKIIEDENLLVGLPESAKAAAKASAEAKGFSNAWRFTLQAPSMIPVMQYAENEELRKEIWSAKNATAREGEFDNRRLIQEILTLRNEKAHLLGFKNFADYTTSRRMVKSGNAARSFIENLREKVDSYFQKEAKELEEFAREHGDETARLKGKIAPWSLGFWAEKMRKENYDFDEETLRPYFELNAVINGMFKIAGTLYGITIQEQTGVPVWHKDVKVYEILDKGKLLCAFYADWHPRETKRAGAWMNPLGDAQHPQYGNTHLGLICGNMTAPIQGKPALLTFDEVLTVFHEFGHLLHHALSEVKIPELAGTNVAWDFVELPSQIMENWCKHPESLSLFAKHFETGTPLPEALLKKLLNALNFRAASACVRQLAFGKMDLDFHLETERFSQCDLDDYWNNTLAKYLVPSAFPQSSIAPQFLHLFSESTGYAAGYYSYKWAEMLEADCFTRFQKEGILNPKTGQAFRKAILSRGNALPADELFKEFMQREPDLTPLLVREGLV